MGTLRLAVGHRRGDSISTPFERGLHLSSAAFVFSTTAMSTTLKGFMPDDSSGNRDKSVFR